jgi:hypothetical protein
VDATHYDNLFNEKSIGMNHSSNLIVEILIQPNIRGLTIENPTKRRTYHDLSNPKLGETSINDLLKRQPIGNY